MDTWRIVVATCACFLLMRVLLLATRRQVVIEAIHGDGGRLSLDPADNCVGIAAAETLKLLGSPSCGVALTLHKARQRM